MPNSESRPREFNSAWHAAWLEAHYALGRHEIEIGMRLSDKERSAFINAHLNEKLDPDTNASSK